MEGGDQRKVTTLGADIREVLGPLNSLTLPEAQDAKTFGGSDLIPE